MWHTFYDRHLRISEILFIKYSMMKKIISNYILMNKFNLENMSKSQLIELVKKLQNNIVKPIAAPRRSVKQMVQSYEENIIQPPLEFRDNDIIPPPIQFRDDYKPTPAPHKLKKSKPVPRTKIEETKKALKGYTKSIQINIKFNKDPLKRLQSTRTAIGFHIKKMLGQMKGVKFTETLKVTFKKMSDDEMIFKNAYFSGTAQTVVNETQINDALSHSQQIILNKIAQWVSEGSGWIVESVDSHYFNIVQYKPMNGSSYIKLPIELQHSKKGLINLKNQDNECFRWCHIRHLNPQDKYPQRIEKVDKKMVDQLNYDGIEFPVTIKQINKIEKQNEINISVFGYENKQPYPIYVSKEKFDDHMELLLITENENKHHVLIKDFNKFMFNQTKNHNKKYFLYALSSIFQFRKSSD